MNVTHQNKICDPLDKCDDSMMIKKTIRPSCYISKEIDQNGIKKGIKNGLN